MSPSLIVFDLDGTLVDSRQDLADAANVLIREHGGSPLPVEAVAAMVGEGAAVLVRRALTAAGLEPHAPGAVARYLALYDERLLNHTMVYDGIPEALAALQPRATLAVLTNKPAEAARRVLAGLDIARAFRWVFGGDGPLPRKPDPAGLLELVRLSGATAVDTVMVGDSAVDLRTARAAGTRVCLARYGFGYRIDAAELTAHDLIADAPADLPRTLGFGL
ncbi:MAG TPA: HAD-IA family hydrolase [Vicinamibacterales bacterium]|nr:HAD-IA family hydrolase [Vicinamibacterales bacterium]